MSKRLSTLQLLSLLGLPLLLILTMVLLTRSAIFAQNADSLSLGVTLDLVLTLPILYFLLIRRTSISRLSISPVTFFGIFMAGWVLPEGQQYYPALLKTYLMPLVELGVVSVLLYKVFKTIRLYKSRREEQPDFYTTLQMVLKKMVPSTTVRALLLSELSVIYYSFFCWKKPAPTANHFSYHQRSGTRSVLFVFLLVIVVETFAIHLLVERWSVVAAWVLSGLSVYTALQLVGFMRSMSKRPIRLLEDSLELRHGMFSEAHVKLDNIQSVEVSRKSSEGLLRLSSFGEMDDHNIILHLKEPQLVYHMYGRRKYGNRLAFFVDNKEDFKVALEKRMGA